MPAPNTQELLYKPDARHTHLGISYSSLFASVSFCHTGLRTVHVPRVAQAVGSGRNPSALGIRRCGTGFKARNMLSSWFQEVSGTKWHSSVQTHCRETQLGGLDGFPFFEIGADRVQGVALGFRASTQGCQN